jgi:hypothetical protein
MDDSQVLLQVLNNVIQRNSKKINDYEVEIANYMTTIIRLEAKLVLLEDQISSYEERQTSLINSKAEDNKK